METTHNNSSPTPFLVKVPQSCCLYWENLRFSPSRHTRHKKSGEPAAVSASSYLSLTFLRGKTNRVSLLFWLQLFLLCNMTQQNCGNEECDCLELTPFHKDVQRILVARKCHILLPPIIHKEHWVIRNRSSLLVARFHIMFGPPSLDIIHMSLEMPAT